MNVSNGGPLYFTYRFRLIIVCSYYYCFRLIIVSLKGALQTLPLDADFFVPNIFFSFKVNIFNFPYIHYSLGVLNRVSIIPRNMSLMDRSMRNIPILEFIHRLIPSERLASIVIMIVYHLHMIASLSL